MAMEANMRRSTALLALALAGLSLAGCADGRYRYGGGVTWASYPYNVWYDGYYGPLYDGYWGTNGFFYFRLHDRDRYRRGDHEHFRRGGTQPDPRFRRYEGNTREPPRGTRMPNYPREGRRDGQDGRRDGYR